MWRTEPSTAENVPDDLWIGVKGQSNPVIAGSPRNILRYSLGKLISGGKALTELGVLPDYQTLSNSECRLIVSRESDGGCEGSSSKGKQPRSTAKVSKSMLSGEGSGTVQTARTLA